jgi:hypothetical protein
MKKTKTSFLAVVLFLLLTPAAFADVLTPDRFLRPRPQTSEVEVEVVIPDVVSEDASFDVPGGVASGDVSDDSSGENADPK